MDARESILSTGNTDELAEIAVEGIVEDELAHKAYLTNTYELSDYEIDHIEIDDWHAEVELTERTSDDEKISHIVTIFAKNENTLIVAADEYRDAANDFNSASYLDESLVELSEELSPVTADGILASSVCYANKIVQIAKNEIGYLEKASNSNLNDKTANSGSANYTKYGAWYGSNPDEWCAMFVSWCANQAGISTSVIPKYASCTTGMNTFKNKGCFYARSATYVPSVGDLFFVGTDPNLSTHTGIVTSVSSTSFTVVDGNYSDKVSTHSYALTNTTILGFAHPSYTHSNYTYKYNNVSHWKACTSCGSALASSSHSYVYQSSKYVCSVCGYSTTNPVTTQAIKDII